MRKGIYRTERRRSSFFKFDFEVIRPMWGQCASACFTEDVGEVVVVQGDSRHVNWSIVRRRFVREEKLEDLSIVHLREIGEGCGVDEGNLQSNQQGWRGWSFGGDQS